MQFSSSKRMIILGRSVSALDLESLLICSTGNYNSTVRFYKTWLAPLKNLYNLVKTRPKMRNKQIALFIFA
jgi:hypothetical protein